MKNEYLISRLGELSQQFPLKIAVKSETKSVSYLEVEKKSNQIANFMFGKISGMPQVIILLDRSPELIETILGLLKSGLVFVPLNPEFPGNRIKKMIDEVHAKWVITSVTYYDKFKDIFAPGGNSSQYKILLIDGNENAHEHFDGVFTLDPYKETGDLVFEKVFNENCYIYFTSGSTGIPKGVLGRHTSLAHFIQWEIEEFGVDENVRVSQLTPPSFDPFLRDIFLPLMTGGTSCIPSQNTLTNAGELIRWIDENEITFIHMIPSLFKTVISEIEDSNCFHHLKYILLAGELLRGRDIHRFIEIFNDRIQLVNLYGPTEATLAKLFYRIRPGDVNRTIIPVGKPIKGAQALLLDDKLRKCPIGKKGEIYIRSPFISAGYYNDSGLNERLFIKNPFGKHPQDIIYKTGDLGIILPEGNIELSGRADSQVKIRGMRIELAEIENRVLMHSDVRETVVMAKEEENGDKYLCAYVVPVPGKKPEMSVIKEFLSKDLPDYMIPSHFVFLNNIPLTLNGKVDRKALPVPGIKTCDNYQAPRDRIEKKLAEIWSGVLGIETEKIGIDDNFFHLGGHSLKAIVLVSRIHKELEVKLPITELFTNPTIVKISQYIKGVKKNKYSGLTRMEKKEYYDLSFAQKRLFILDQAEGLINTAYNMPGAMLIEGHLDIGQIEHSFTTLVKRHDSFRTSFDIKGGKPVQIIYDTVAFKIKYSTLEEQPGGDASDSGKPKELSQVIKDFIKPFKLDKASLLRVALIRLGSRNHLLMFDMHHIISDGISRRTLVKEFLQLYEGKNLPELKFQYKDFIEWENRQPDSEEMKKQEDFWLNRFSGDIQLLNMPTDYPRPPVKDFKGNTIGREIDRILLGKIKKVMAETGVTLYMILLAVFNILLSRYSGQEDIVVGAPLAGRSHPDLENIVGMFVNTLAIRNYPWEELPFGDFLQEVKEYTLKAFENQDYPFEELVNKLGIPKDYSRNPLFDVLFVSENLDIPGLELKGLTFSPVEIEKRISHMDLVFYIVEGIDKIVIRLEYATALFKQSSIEEMLKHYVEILEQAVNDISIQLKEIDISQDLLVAQTNIIDENLEDFGF